MRCAVRGPEEPFDLVCPLDAENKEFAIPRQEICELQDGQSCSLRFLW
jgi:hypothetical protein